MSTLRRLLQEVKDLSFSQNNYATLLAIDKYGAFGDGINIYLDVNRYTGEVKSIRPETDRLMTKLFTSYLLEMYMCYANGDFELFIDSTYWSARQPKPTARNIASLAKIQRLYNDIYAESHGALSPIANLILPITHEQIEIQEGYERYLNRFYKIYGSNEGINEIFKTHFGIGLKTYMALAWGVFAYTFYKKIAFDSDDIMVYLSSTKVEKCEVEIFLSMISLNREELKNKYESYRKNDDGVFLDWNKRSAVDKGLQKVSFFYPFLKTGNKYALVSYTAMQEFLKFHGLYRVMTSDIPDFKSKYSGPLFEDYVRAMAQKYSNDNGLDAKIYGDAEYLISKKEPRKEPDMIFEMDDYILIIECKTSPYSPNLVKNLDPSYLYIGQGIDKSIKNIEDFLLHRTSDIEGKRIVKLVVFYEGIHMAFSILKKEIAVLSKGYDIIVIDVDTLELLFTEYLKPIPVILDEYKEFEKINSTNLNSYLRRLITSDVYLEDEENIMQKILCEDLGLDVVKTIEGTK